MRRALALGGQRWPGYPIFVGAARPPGE